MRTSVVTRLMRNVIGTMSPCHSPAQKSAGGAPATLYLEPGPATARKLGIGHLGSSAVVAAQPNRALPVGARQVGNGPEGRECDNGAASWWTAAPPSQRCLKVRLSVR